MDLEVNGSPEQSEDEDDEGATAPAAIVEVLEEQSPLIVVAGLLNELAPQEEVTESESVEGEPIEAPSFAFGKNNEKELPSTYQSSSPCIINQGGPAG